MNAAPNTATKSTTTYAAQYGIVVGDIVVAGSYGDTDADMGEIIAIADDGDTATVAWEIGACQTTVTLSGVDVLVWAPADRDDAKRYLASLRAGVESHR